MNDEPYTQKYFDKIVAGSLQSARELVPIVLKLTNPKSVVDVGCGIGAWSSIFLENKVPFVTGVDGPWVDKSKLLIPEASFIEADLRKPLHLDKKFDLVVCLEVAEHLPSNAAASLVASLTSLGPIVMFSSAIPFQGGDNHFNEQWPEYWAKLFNEKGFEVVDCLRKRIWDNEKVLYWYSQNTFLFVQKQFLKSNRVLLKEYNETNKSMLSLVHPEMYALVATPYDKMRKLPGPIKWVIKKVSRLK